MDLSQLQAFFATLGPGWAVIGAAVVFFWPHLSKLLKPAAPATPAVPAVPAVPLTIGNGLILSKLLKLLPLLVAASKPDAPAEVRAAFGAAVDEVVK